MHPILRWSELKTKYKVLVAVLVILAVSTVIPVLASKPNFLGYYSHCSWTPLSTAICAVAAYVVYWFGNRRK